MFEQIIRPFQTSPVLKTDRIVKSVSIDKGERAFLSWGAAGTVPAGALQPTPTPGSQRVGFSIQNAKEEYNQVGTPVTEDVKLNGVTIKRVRSITFLNATLQGFDTSPFNSLAAAGVSDVVAGLLLDIEGSRAKQSTYKTTWD